MERYSYIYIMANENNTVTYTGVTTNLIRRVYEYREKLVKGFTKTYNITKLVYYEVFGDLEYAIIREKRLKGSSRSRKVKLINSVNPQWLDLYGEITGAEEISGIMNRDVNS
jgi:putative endonuclease